MSLILTAVICLTMVGTAFLSGLFGMAGGLTLMGVLLVIMPVPDAMMLHGVTQMASNGWRGLLWIKHVRWSAMVAYLAGCAAALVAWSLWRYVPSKAMAPVAPSAPCDMPSTRNGPLMKRSVAPTSFRTSTSVRRRWRARRIVDPTTASTEANTTRARSAAAATPPLIR